MKMCVLDENKVCVHCGECSRCDLDPGKICDSCGKCLETGADSRAILIDAVITDETKI